MSDDGGELQALTDLLGSQGWVLFKALVDAEWNAERVLEKQTEALSAVPRGDQIAVNDTVQQINATRREILKLLERPKERIAQLTAHPKSKRPFAEWRRA